MNHLTKREKVAYGLGDLSSNIVLAAISFYLLYFMVNVAGLNPGLAGVVFIIAKAWDAVTDYMMGVISDRTHSRYGKRRVYMLFGAIPYGIIFVLLWLCPFNESTAQFVKFLYYTGVYMLFNTAWTVVYVPYNALTASLTQDYDERTSLNGIRIIFANIGLLLGAALFALLAEGEGSIFADLFHSVKTGYMVAGILFGMIAAVVMILSAKGVKERYQTVTISTQSFWASIRDFLRLKEFRYTMLYFLCSMVGFDVIMANFLFLVNDSLGYASIGGGELSMIFIALPLVAAIASATFWVKASEKYDKVKVYSAAVIWVIVGLLGCIVIPAYQNTTPIISYISLGVVVVVIGIAMSALQILPFASIPDVVEVDEYMNGVRREGAYYGFVQFMYKTASGLSIFLIGIILAAFGYVESTDGSVITQPDSALLAIRLVMGILPGIFFIYSVYFARKANLRRDRFNEIKAKIAERNANHKDS